MGMFTLTGEDGGATSEEHENMKNFLYKNVNAITCALIPTSVPRENRGARSVGA